MRRHLVHRKTVRGLYLLDARAKFHRGWAVVGVPGHRPVNDSGDVIWDAVLTQIGGPLCGNTQELRDDLLPVAAFESSVSGERAEKGRTEAIDVARLGRRITAEDFRGGERGRGEDGSGFCLEPPGDAGDAEVRQRRLAVVGEQDV